MLERIGVRIERLFRYFELLSLLCHYSKRRHYVAALYVGGGFGMTLMTRCWYRFWSEPGRMCRLNSIVELIGRSGSGKHIAVDLYRLMMEPVKKSDAVQIAHHCFNYLPKMYEWVSAPVASVPNRFYGAHAHDNIHKLREVLKYIKDNQIYYSGDATYEFEATKNGFVNTASYPLVGKEFDMSWSHKHTV